MAAHLSVGDLDAYGCPNPALGQWFPLLSQGSPLTPSCLSTFLLTPALMPQLGCPPMFGLTLALTWAGRGHVGSYAEVAKAAAALISSQVFL